MAPNFGTKRRVTCARAGTRRASRASEGPSDPRRRRFEPARRRIGPAASSGIAGAGLAGEPITRSIQAGRPDPCGQRPHPAQRGAAIYRAPNLQCTYCRPAGMHRRRAKHIAVRTTGGKSLPLLSGGIRTLRRGQASLHRNSAHSARRRGLPPRYLQAVAVAVRVRACRRAGSTRHGAAIGRTLTRFLARRVPGSPGPVSGLALRRGSPARPAARGPAPAGLASSARAARSLSAARSCAPSTPSSLANVRRPRRASEPARLAELVVAAGLVQHVVDDLEEQPQLDAEGARRVDAALVRARDDRATGGGTRRAARPS